MSEIQAYTPPDSLQNSDIETIHENMRQTAPSDIDTSEGSFYWDATRPVAIEISEFAEMKLNETVKLFFPQWSYDVWLDYHAEICGLRRKTAVKSAGQIEITGTIGKLIPSGFQIAVPSVNDKEAIIFKTIESVMLDETGKGLVFVEADVAGTNGNVAANTITIMVNQDPDITKIINPIATDGGLDIESDESLRERILALNQGAVGSGTKNDYEQWAKEVSGVGDAYCVPLENGPGTVTVYILDSDGAPANQDIINSVIDFICPTDGNGKAPIGANVSVFPISPQPIDYSMHIVIKPGYDVLIVQQNISDKLNEYYRSVGIGGLYKYIFALQKIAESEGLDDVSDFTINGGTANIQIEVGKFPSVGTVTWI